MADRDYYEVLGLARNATPDQIKSAYRKLAKKFHPDRNRNDKDSERRFKEVHQAYEVLHDPAKRRTYDQFGHAGPRVGHGGGGAGWRPGPGSTGGRTHRWESQEAPGPGGFGADGPIEDIEDLFRVFGGAAGRGAQRPGGPFEDFFSRVGGRSGPRAAAQPDTPSQSADAEHEVPLTFEEALRGRQLDVRISREGGVSETVSVKIPSGVHDGQRIRVRGKGQSGIRGGPPGDLYIICRVGAHPYFRREGDDIYIDLPLTITEATLGTKVEIPTLEGKTVLTVPPGTASGAKLRLKNLGVKPPGEGARGHQYAMIRIVPPKQLSPEQVRLLEQFRNTGENSPRSDIGW